MAPPKTFTDLPGELRNRIYRYTMYHEARHIFCIYYGVVIECNDPREILGLSSTCRLIRQESMEVYFAMNHCRIWLSWRYAFALAAGIDRLIALFGRRNMKCMGRLHVINCDAIVDPRVMECLHGQLGRQGFWGALMALQRRYTCIQPRRFYWDLITKVKDAVSPMTRLSCNYNMHILGEFWPLTYLDCTIRLNNPEEAIEGAINFCELLNESGVDPIVAEDYFWFLEYVISYELFP